MSRLTPPGRRLVILVLLGVGPLEAQGHPAVSLGARAIGILTRAEPVPGGGDLTEARMVQPLVMIDGRAWQGRLRAVGTLNLEGQTIPEGELVPGAWGEGFHDRRHPHTYVHELMLSASDLLGRLDGAGVVTLSAGKGFAPFGSDDPMTRPAIRYPVNHHLAQILERAVIMAGVRAGPVVVEAGVFNGDEPERPGQWPNWDRFGDSWSGRASLLPAAGLELAVSRARVRSPEHRPGAGTDAWKWHLVARMERPLAGGRAYALGEWARTEEADGFFVFRSLLVEAAWSRGRHAPYYRFERSDRPEDLRTTDPFRSVRPHLENAIAGTTRWTVHTLGYGVNLASGDQLDLRPFLEVSLGTMRNIDAGIFQPRAFYGRESFHALSVGLKASWRLTGHRMGRYGGLFEDDAARGDVHHHSGM